MPSLQNIKLKICGLRDNIEEIMSLAPDFMGFIFYEKSPRYVGEHFRKPKNIKATSSIGVFVDQPVEEVLELSKRHELGLVQLHGNESVDYCVELKAMGLKIIKVFAGNSLPSPSQLDAYAPFIDYYLFDTKGEYLGGNGVAFNWNKLTTLNLKKPIFLSGGIDLDNVNDLKKLWGVEIFAIDVNSRFEISPGKKDISKLIELKTLLNK